VISGVASLIFDRALKVLQLQYAAFLEASREKP